MDSILVIGATGKVGQHLVKALAEKNADFTVFVRDAAKAQSTFGSKVKTAVGENFDIDSFKAAVAGKTRLFVLTNTHPHEPVLVKHAVEAGVKHVVKISCVKANVGDALGSFFQTHGASEYDINQIPNVTVTFLRPHDFMQNLLVQAHAFKGQGPYMSAHPNSYLASIDARDIADVAATVLTDPIEKHAGIAYTLTGPQALTITEQLDIAARVLGTGRIPVQEVDDAQRLESLLGHGVPYKTAWAIVNLSQTYRLFLTGHRWVTSDVKIVTGKEPRSWEQFFHDHKQLLV